MEEHGRERSVWASRVLVGALIAAAFITAFFVFVKERDPGSGEFHPKDSFLAITDERTLEVRNGANGKLMRLMKEDLARARRFPMMAVTPSGRYVYHDAAEFTCGGETLPVIKRVDLVRGVELVFAIGRWPALSPDGKHIAYVAPSNNDRPIAHVDRGRGVCDADETGEFIAVIHDLDTDRATLRPPTRGGLGIPRWRTDSGSFVSGAHVIHVRNRRATAIPKSPFTPLQFLSKEEALALRCDPRCVLAIVDADDWTQIRALPRPRRGQVSFAELDQEREQLLVSSSTGAYVVDLGSEEQTTVGDDVVSAVWLA